MPSRFSAYILAAVIFAADQLTKWWILGPLALREVRQVYVLPFFNFTYTENHGISLGLLTASSDVQRCLLVAFTAAIAVGVAIWIWREKSRTEQLILALVLGGALGNILDRSRLGYVVDFADLHFGEFRPFLIFNVGDAAISIGVAILLLRAFLLRNEPEEKVEHA
jgi:signal peptidase II